MASGECPQIGSKGPDFGAMGSSGERERMCGREIDIETTDLFALQDDLAGSSRGGRRTGAASLGAARRGGTLGPPTLVRQGTLLLHRLTRDTNLSARALFRQVGSSIVDATRSILARARTGGLAAMMVRRCG